MKYSHKATKLIKHFEGLRLKSYKDGGGKWTIGWGHTKRVFEGMRITQPEAEEFLVQDMDEHAFELDRMLKVPVYQNQYDALLSLVFNMGAPKIETSTLIKMINEGNDNAVKQFSRWIHGLDEKTGLKGPVQGLIRRRAAEQELFETGELILE